MTGLLRVRRGAAAQGILEVTSEEEPVATIGGHSETPDSVAYPAGTSAAVLFHQILRDAVERFPQALGGLAAPDSVSAFRDEYPDFLPRFEAARAAAENRTEIARVLAVASADAIVWAGETEEVPVGETLQRPAAPIDLEMVGPNAAPGLLPEVRAEGKSLTGAQLRRFVADLGERNVASGSVATSIDWLLDLADGESGRLDLSDRRVALLGAAAELAPTPLWLQGGAEVLWLDVVPPSSDVLEASRGGVLHWPPGGVDLLRRPGEVAASLRRFAADSAIDLGLYAYAPGRGREWRLVAAMNAVVAALPAGAVRSVTVLVSPTSPGVLTAGDLVAEAHQRATRPGWQAGLDRLGLLGSGPGHATHGDVHTNRGVVSIQGAGYQAAQYLGKLMTAETWATWGRPSSQSADPFRVSANTAGISRTASLRHPVFDTAFGGAAAFGIETYAPATTRSLNGLLTIRDLIDPEAPASPSHEFLDDAARASAVTTTRVHGGIYAFPYPLDPALRVATAIGVARDPRRIPAIVRRR